ncbi:Bax inhibitor-1/YccA family protein [Nocardioides jejuensis]|uniref:Bax inhibitor-1/YccA family protein n=1 Tax=Nocardioides jejuensis TaxID=2502782 RepID=A0A4R1CBY2_9ACTN|nr:Bax inhibitor-1/YccA family protein [Nocardioides jejuensis]TCJ28623.1 Bax inhibitor-1/YccA family protein [Nocardioides jejuensis]
MRSNNPVFNNSAEFNGRGGYGQTAYPQQGYVPGEVVGGTYAPAGRRMSIDSVVQSTGISLVVVVLAAAATWVLTGDINGLDNYNKLYAASIIGGGLAFVLSMVNSFKKVISPALVVAFAAAEGVAVGAISKTVGVFIGEGIVMQAVLGTFAAFAGTLAAYKFLNINVSDKFRKGVVAVMFGMVALSLLEVVLGLFGNGIGLFGMGPAALLFAVAGLVMGVFMLILDFDFIEKGIAYGLDERESWRAAFGLTVSLVWIYTNLLRILAILNQD